MPRPGGGTHRHLRTLFNLGRTADLTDGELLERYLSREGEPSELAFAALVERHGPMVLRTCRAVLRDEHESRDAFQATFQVLLRKARSLRVRDSLGPWLHQVALRTARCSRARAHRRRQAEAVAAEASASKAPADPADRHDLGEILHLELSRLPDRYRSPVVLCCLEGLSLDQAARRLGWPLGTVQSRLARGRKTLRDRLARRGVAPTAGAFASLLAAERAGAAVPIALAEATVAAGGHLPAGSSAAGIVPAAVLALTEGVLRSMFLTKLKIGTAALVVVGGGSWAGASLVAVGPPGGNPANPAAPPAVALSHPDEPEAPPDATAPDDEPESEPSLAEQFAALRAEYDAKMEAMRDVQQKVDDRDEQIRISIELSPSLEDYARRMVNLAETDPTSEAA
jgi:RNA polymerase sigma factor (sigma-70 family)